MKKLALLGSLILSFLAASAHAADLLEVYRQALVSDPTYQQAISQRLVNRENVPIALSYLLPNLGMTGTPGVSHATASGPAAYLGSGTIRGYQMQLTLTQTIFDFAQVAALLGANAIAKQADATLSAATQDLMIRVAQAYFAVLQDIDNVRYIESTKKAYQKQLDQVKQQYKVGLKTVTDVYTAQASYETSVASYISALNTLAVDKENLRAITGVLYPNLAVLSENFPLIEPSPANIDEWVTAAGKQNWSIKAARFAAESAREAIKQQFAGHLPTLNIQGIYNSDVTHNSGGDPTIANIGSAQVHTKSAVLNLNFPIFEGGLVVAETNQAKYTYQVALQQLELQLRTTLTQTRQSYLGVLAGIHKVEADKQAIKSAISSLRGMEAGYRVGTEILVNVLNQQQNVFLAQQQYAADRYAYVNNLLLLKMSAGTLSQEDLAAINSWLRDEPNSYKFPERADLKGY